MISNMSIGSRITFGFAAVTLLAVGGIVAMNQYSMGKLAQHDMHSELRGYAKTLKNSIQAEANRAEAMSALVANLPQARKLFADNDRQGLFDLFGPAFSILKKDYSVRQFQFHKPPAISFARIHKPAKFGDDLSSFRKTVVNTNATKLPTVGTEVGVAGLGVRGMVPVFNDGEHLGSVEFGLSFGQAFFNRFKSDFGVEAALYLKRGEEYQRFATTFGELNPASEADLNLAYSGTVSYGELQFGGEPMLTLATQITNFSGNAIGVVMIGKSAAASVAALADARDLALLFAGIAFIVVLILAAAISRTITRPIKSILGTMESLASGDYETGVPAQNRSDEIGVMARSVEIFKQSLIETRKLEAGQLSMQENSKAEKQILMERLSTEFETKFGGIIGEVVDFAAELQSSAQHLTSIADKANTRSGSVMEASQQASQNVDAVAAAAEELSASIEVIRAQVDNSATITTDAVAEATRTESTVQGLVETVEKINTVVGLIADIADQTNLLALNATIEAARAGDAGKGFAVVASEVKNLAVQTAKATDDISNQINAVQKVTKDASHAMENIVKTIGSIDEISVAISHAVQEQGVATQEIAQNVDHAATGTRNVTDNIQGVAGAADETGQAASQTLIASDKLENLSHSLRTEMNAFLEEIRAA